jgi:iron complex transport system substrate-binding protein
MSRNKLLVFISMLAAIGLLLGACSSPATPAPTPTAQTIDLTDGLGRGVHLEAPAARVVSLAASNTEILYAIGAGPQVVGRDEFSDYPTEAKSLPTVGGSYGGYSYETIVSLKPDLVLAAEINTPEQVKALDDLKVKVYYLKNPVDMDGLYQNLEIVGQLTGHVAEAQQLSESLKARVKAVQDKIAPLSSRPTVFYELDGSNPAAPYTFGPGTFMNMLIELAGGTNVGSTLDAQWAQMSLEALLVQNPSIILLGDAAYGVTPESLATRPGWEKLAAVQNNQIFTIDDNLISRPGPRQVDGLEALAKIFHPEVFK